ncbi:MAG: ABC transporter permease subunit [Phycisphaerae bacterium]
MQFLAVLIDSFRESRESRIFWIMLAGVILILGFLASISFSDANLHLFFGLISIDLTLPSLVIRDPGSLSDFVVTIIFEFVLGMVGMMLMVIATAHIIPSLMDTGVAGILLSKPISRGRLFVYKYISAMVFVFVQASIAVTGSFLIMGLRWGEWRPGYLLAVPTVVLIFSYIYCISALVGMKTRSAVASTLLSIVAWMVFSIVPTLPTLFELDGLRKYKDYTSLYNTVVVVSWIPPKTSDTSYFIRRWSELANDQFDAFVAGNDASPEDQQMAKDAKAIDEKLMDKSATASIGSSLLFEFLVIGFCVWNFSRRDF